VHFAPWASLTGFLMKRQDSILLIDPFKNLVDVYQMILEGEKFFVDTASNIEEAFQRLSRQQYSIIITEYFPEIENSSRIIPQVKKNTPETYILMVTNKEINIQSYENLFDDGVDDIVLKPYPPEKVLVHIRKGLRQRGLITRNQQLEKEIALDSIGGQMQKNVFNRIYFRQCLRQELKRAKRHHHPLSLLLLPIPAREKMGDQFDKFYGEVAKILREYTREEDMVGRENGNWGILLPETDQTGSKVVLQRLTGMIQKNLSLQSDKILGPMVRHLSFQSFTYPHDFGAPMFLKNVLEEIEKENSHLTPPKSPS
jgi:diguanylate cyclase (GGDEF)-like protein